MLAFVVRLSRSPPTEDGGIEQAPTATVRKPRRLCAFVPFEEAMLFAASAGCIRLETAGGATVIYMRTTTVYQQDKCSYVHKHCTKQRSMK